MATLVLTVVGSADRRAGRRGDRRADRAADRPRSAVQAQGPRRPAAERARSRHRATAARSRSVFGTMRVAGNGDLVDRPDREPRDARAAARGSRRARRYSYAASFAVALSARPILGVGRIWADGKLLRGRRGGLQGRDRVPPASGRRGSGARPADRRGRGRGMAPAHRGIAYAVFEDMRARRFRQSHPVAELRSDRRCGAGRQPARSRGALAGDVLTADEGTTALAGFAASGASARAVIETLAGAAGAMVPRRCREAGAAARRRRRGGTMADMRRGRGARPGPARHRRGRFARRGR